MGSILRNDREATPGVAWLLSGVKHRLSAPACTADVGACITSVFDAAKLPLLD